MNCATVEQLGWLFAYLFVTQTVMGVLLVYIWGDISIVGRRIRDERRTGT